MAIDKKVTYEMQGHTKPARNYLGKQKTVKNVPIKWKSGPHSQPTELAYITKAEKDLILKKDLHGSLKKGANTGPDGVMSLDSQGDYTRDRSQDKARSQMSRGDSERAVRQEAHMKSILTGQKDIGQTAKVSKRTRRGAVPEYVKIKQPDGTYKDKYVGSSIKGKRGWIDRLFRRGNVRTKGIKFQPGVGWVSEDERVGDIKPGWGGRIIGGLASLATGIPIVGGAIGSAIDYGKGIFGKKPRDMSEFNRLGLYSERNQPGLEDFQLGSQKIQKASNVPMASLAMYNMGKTPVNNTQILPRNKPINVGAGDFISNINNPNNMASGMQMSDDSLNNNFTTPFRPTDAMTGNYNTGAIPNRNRTNFNKFTGQWTGAKDGGRIGYENGELVTDESMMEATPAGMMQENVEEVQEEPSRELLEALAMEIFQLPLEELNEEQLMVVYQAAMQQQPAEEAVQEEDVQFAMQQPPMEEAVQEEDVQFAAGGGRAGYQFGDRVEQQTDFIEGPQGGNEFQETVVEGQEQPSQEQLEALAMEIFQLPLEELDEQQLLVVYQEAMQGQPMEEAVQEEDVQFAAQGGLAGLL